MHWHWQDVESDDWTIFFVHFQQSYGLWLMSKFCLCSISCESIDLGGWTLSMISYRSVKMTSNYPTSCLEMRRKQKVNKPIFKGCPRKNICKYQHFNHIVFSCSACLQKDNYLSDSYAFIVRYAAYKAWSLHKGQLTLRCHCFPSPKWLNRYFKVMIMSAIICA